jgi:hypothetical protein
MMTLVTNGFFDQVAVEGSAEDDAVYGSADI